MSGIRNHFEGYSQWKAFISFEDVEPDGDGFKTNAGAWQSLFV